ncbi:MAG: GNAT family N-acetyltransferase [Planctomycetota bacterium]|nr:GNAT family N-acetyltransferase [Planctomycetota bacterium]
MKAEGRGDAAESLRGARPLEEPDVPGVIELIGRCYAEYGLRLNLEDECEAHLSHLIEHFRAPDDPVRRGGEFWVREDGSGVVRATAALALERSDAAVSGELKSMYVDGPWRRMGIGRGLAELVIREARGRGCDELVLWSDTRFTKAHAMYEALGFQRFGLRDIHDSNASKEWGYRLALERAARGLGPRV